jgi:hypothetical protein
MLEGKINPLAYFHLTLELDSTRRPMGTINHLQVIRFDDRIASKDITHTVRFWDGSNHRSLEGKVTVEEEGVRLFLDMGKGKTYRFRKLGT